MKSICKLIIILLFFLQQFSFSQIKEVDSLKHSFITVYKETIDKNVTDKEINEIIDTLFNSATVIDSELINRIESFFLKKTNKIYTVGSGDCLWTIAERELDNPYKWGKIYNLNLSNIKKPNLIFTGQKFIIPLEENDITRRDSLLKKIVTSIPADTTKKEENKVGESNKRIYKDPDDLEIEAIIIDETITKLGHDFYDDFYSSWEPPDTLKNYSITIEEKPLPQLGTQISVFVNEIKIFQQFIQPRSEIIEGMANYAVQLASEFIENYETIQSDLQGNDLKGTGIY